MAGERLMTATELADYLGLPRRSIYYWANKGSIPHVRVGRSLRFVPEQVRRDSESTKPLDRSGFVPLR